MEMISDSLLGNSYPYFCNCCRHKIKKFLPYGAKSDIYTRYHIVGGGWRAAQCPICGSIDRWRWFLYMIQKHTDIFQNECTVLHFAPEEEVSKYFRKCSHITYFAADKDTNRADCKIDMTDIPFQDGRFDYIIANHVLSYIKNEAQAIHEMKRCLKPAGRILLSFPICMNFDTYEDYEAKERGMDLEVFGTRDNVRMYGKDYKERLEKYGLKITQYSPENELSHKEIEHLGLLADDVILMCKK